jgi:tetratricopeptide (TPR) repeat protein
MTTRATSSTTITVVRATARHLTQASAWRAGAARLALAWLVGAVAPSFAAEESALQFPTQDDAVVEHLPTHVGDAAQRRAARTAERAQRTALQQHPDELGLALRAAHDALARGRLRGDPRELGVAQAALAPWWSRADAPPDVRLVRATVLQSQHEFKAALVELDAVLALPDVALPVRAQAELTRAGVQQVLGRFAEAEAGCKRLAGVDFRELGSGVRLNALACVAELASLQGHADTAAATLARLAGAPDASSAATVAGSPAPGWLTLMRAELAQRRGDPGAGALFAAALKSNPDVYTQCAYADWLLDQHRAAEVVALLKGNEAADPVLLRVALAYKQLHGRNATLTQGAATMLGERYDAALLRGDKSHGREQSRYELALRGDTRAALVLARSNWSVQHEPADEVVLAQAAHAARRDAAAEPLWQFLRETGGRDVRLAAGGPAAAAFVPTPMPDTRTVSRSEP